MTALTSPVTLTPLLGVPEVHSGDDLAGIVLEALQANGIELLDGDVLVVSSKVASKAMGLFAPAAQRADVVLSQTVRVVAERMTPWGVTRIVESAAGPVMAAAGVDASNTAKQPVVLTLPADPDAAAAGILDDVQSGWAARSGTRPRIGLILSDTAGRPWRIGQTDFALGAAGIHVVDDLRGLSDADGRALSVTERCIADEIASAADLVKGKTTGVPVAHIRGLGIFVHGGGTPDSDDDRNALLMDRPAGDTGGRDTQDKDTQDKDTPGRDTQDKDTPGRDTQDKDTPGSDTRGSGFRRGDTGDGAVRGSRAQLSESRSGARGLVRTGPGDWFGLGRSEAVRAALGVQPGSAEATAVGIPAIDGETLADKANRALRVALLPCPDASGRIEANTMNLVAADDFSLGVVTTRAQVALRGEGLTATLTRALAEAAPVGDAPPALPPAVIAFREE